VIKQQFSMYSSMLSSIVLNINRLQIPSYVKWSIIVFNCMQHNRCSRWIEFNVKTASYMTLAKEWPCSFIHNARSTTTMYMHITFYLSICHFFVLLNYAVEVWLIICIFIIIRRAKADIFSFRPCFLRASLSSV